MEEKLDNIVNLLTSTRTNAPDEDPLHEQADSGYIGLPTTASNTQSSSNLRVPNATVSGLSPSTAGASLSTSPGSGQSRPLHGSGLLLLSSGDLDEETCLNIFRVYMAENIPFVIVDCRTTVQELRRDRPFLLKAIIITASYTQIDRQTRLGKEFIQELSQRMLMEGEKSLDLLQGLLVYVGW